MTTKPPMTFEKALHDHEEIIRLHQTGQLSESIVRAGKALIASRADVRTAHLREVEQARREGANSVLSQTQIGGLPILEEARTKARAETWREAAARTRKLADKCGIRRRDMRERGSQHNSTSLKKARARELMLRQLAQEFEHRASGGSGVDGSGGGGRELSASTRSDTDETELASPVKARQRENAPSPARRQIDPPSRTEAGSERKNTQEE